MSPRARRCPAALCQGPSSSGPGTRTPIAEQLPPTAATRCSGWGRPGQRQCPEEGTPFPFCPNSVRGKQCPPHVGADKNGPGSHTPESMVPKKEGHHSVWPHWAVTSRHHTCLWDAFINHVPSQLGGSVASCRGSPQSHLIHHPRSVRLQRRVHSNYRVPGCYLSTVGSPRPPCPTVPCWERGWQSGNPPGRSWRWHLRSERSDP